MKKLKLAGTPYIIGKTVIKKKNVPKNVQLFLRNLIPCT